jgi:hypothetical protein
VSYAHSAPAPPTATTTTANAKRQYHGIRVLIVMRGAEIDMRRSHNFMRRELPNGFVEDIDDWLKGLA